MQKVCEAYDSGALRVPLVTLQCIKYDEALFRDMLSTVYKN